MYLAKRTRDLFPTLFNDLFDWSYGNIPSMNVPQMNIIENEEEYKLELSVPGLTKEDLTLNIDDNKDLVVEMVKKTNQEEKDKNQHYLRREFTSTQFKEVLALPENVHIDHINAKIENGILEVLLPKIKPEEKKLSTKNIEIK